MARSKSRRSQPARGPIARAFLFVVKAGAILAVAGTLGVAVAVAIAYSTLPDFDQMMRSPNGQSVEIRGAGNEVLVSVGPSYGEWLPYGSIPKVMTDAMISVEDKRFRYHPGFDPISAARSLLVNFQSGRKSQGASTITQQLARNVFLTASKTYARKAREIILALAIERKFTKEAILELYLNRVYFGGGAYGVDAASRKFFGHGATRLGLEEAAIVAGLVQAPSRFAPSADADAARRRANIVLGTMVRSGSITPGEAAAADVATVRFSAPSRRASVRYFTDWVLSEVENLTDETIEPLQVTTTLDIAGQRAAEAALAAETPGGAQAALVALARDGAVRAMVGGRDYVKSNYNRAVAARRQPGSAFKFFVYAAAIEDGVSPDDVMQDKPLTIGRWSPRNSNGRYVGPITVRDAFAQSVNTVAVELAARVGFDTVADTARRFGITTPIDRRPAMALGASDVTLLEMTQAYATVANGGVEARPYAITRITSGSGKVLYERESGQSRVIVAPFVAAKMTELMQAAVETGTGRAAQIGRPLAGKTGTTSSNKDGWFLGFTNELTTGVWMGRDDARAVPGLAGGRAPARAFAAYMARAVGGTPPAPLVTDIDTGFPIIEPDDQVYGIEQGYGPEQQDPAVPTEYGPDGEPLVPGNVQAPPAAPPETPAPQANAQPKINDEWLNRVLVDMDPNAH
ncbi:penicillin-binding protein 1A [Polymorphobacter glacialis]|uniref:Penicillin-binding protein 1A n=1 Tax=Sandarakinorhabdus glacialis TaxID=1614636 RepID=A0A916ZS84_9SPHN|nr:PBP1A family penicillin-binding protein [Polymorphobacter glacialis]GGE11754.1 penicillin-binding protein 1A [Polymorphobacter glacialis]